MYDPLLAVVTSYKITIINIDIKKSRLKNFYVQNKSM